MTLPRTLEKPILEAIIRYAYALHEDEEAALLSAFLVISYHFHREAVEWMLPGENYEQYVSEQMEQMEQEIQVEPIEQEKVLEPAEGPLEVFSPEALVMKANATASEPAQRSSFLAGRISGAVAAIAQTARRTARRREIALQEEEEAALFHTIESVAFDVNREAIEQEVLSELGGGSKFLAAREWLGEKVAKVVPEPAREESVIKEIKKSPVKRGWETVGRYNDIMDEELQITRRIIDRNIAVADGYKKAQAN